MAKKITLFPTLAEKRVKDIFKFSQPLFSYTKGYESIDLELDNSEDAVSHIKGAWNAEENNLKISWHFEYQNAARLYGVDEPKYACACHNAQIGVALCMSSAETKRRKSWPVAILQNDSDKHIVHIDNAPQFQKGELRGNVEFSLVLYLRSAGESLENTESHFANAPGTLLGTLMSKTIILDGDGSIIPICEVSRPGEPLWFVEYNIEDPSSDDFCETVTIYLNKAHDDFELINHDAKNKKYCQQMLVEIMANAIAVVIETVRAYEGNNDFSCLSDYDEGSVAQALKYFKEQLGWDFSNPASVSNSVRKHFGKKDINGKL